MYWLKKRFTTLPGSLPHHLRLNRALALYTLYPIGLTRVTLFSLYFLAMASPVSAMDDEDIRPCPSSFIRPNLPHTLDNGTTAITCIIDNERRDFPLTAIPTYVYNTPGSAPDPSTLQDASAWVAAMQNWAHNSYASPAQKYRFVHEGTIYALEGVYTLANAPRYTYSLEFKKEDNHSTHMTLITATPFFRDGETRVNLDSMAFQVHHRILSQQTVQNRSTLYYDGRLLYEPEIREVAYERPAVSGIAGLESRKPFGNTTECVTTGRELSCLALKAITTPEGGDFQQGKYHKLSSEETDSPFIYSNGQGLFMTRHIKTVCGIGVDDGIDYTFDYIMPAPHELKLKEGYRLLSPAQLQPGFLPQGLYEWRNDWWVGLDKTFTPIFEQTYQLQSPIQNTTCFKDVIFDRSVSNTQVIRDSLNSPYLTVLNFSMREFVNEDKNELGVLLGKLTNLEYLNLEREPHDKSWEGPFPRDISKVILPLEGYRNFSSLIGKLTKLKQLNLSNNFLNGINLRELNSLTQLEDLDMSFMLKQSWDHFKLYLVFLRYKKNWDGLINSEGTGYIAQYFTNLTKLNLRGNPVGGNEGMLIRDLPKLTWLNLLDSQPLRPLLNNIPYQTHSNLRMLYTCDWKLASHCPNLTCLEGGSIENNSISLIGQSCLNLARLRIGHRSVIAGETVAQYFTNLTSLALNDCSIEDGGAEAIGKKLTNLTSLNITMYSNIGTKGALAIGNYLTKLQNLNLSVSCYKQGDALIFARQFNLHSTLRTGYLQLTGNLNSDEVETLRLLKNRCPNLNILYQTESTKGNFEKI